MNEDRESPLVWVAGLLFGVPAVVGWLVSRVPAAAEAARSAGVVVPAAEAVWVLPVGEVGLDLPRIAILAGAILLLAAGAVLGIRARMARTSERR